MRSHTHRRLIALAVLALVTLALIPLSVGFGVRNLGWTNVLSALGRDQLGTTAHLVVWELRLPRTLAALICGGALGLAGALMQVLTRNPLADPGLLGVNGGAAMGVVLGIWGLGISSQTGLILPALGGAGVAAALVFLLGGTPRGQGPDPMRLILAGAAVSALFLALTWAILILSRESLDVYRFWVLGAFSDIRMADLLSLWPAFAIALPLAAAAALLLDPLTLGDDTARALGVRVGLARVITILAIVGLCGTTVSLAGPIAFIGLVVPHLIRPLSGADVRLLALGSFLAGALLAITADTLGRVLLPGREIEAGAMMALIGGPTLVLLVRLRRGVAL
ncbi:iron ABC transporter permease [uncultured Roseobacter sp.]|uniref:FecCD family ABC transporter permease n=1 Tax=uncultured Roseobacter sp. TaxID=114847 RepID=UPI0026132EDB|nr:iron ABC transporter permease [uncultured Roseobacter sp.]